MGSSVVSSAGRTEQMIGALIPPVTRRRRPSPPLIVPELPRPALPADDGRESLLLDMAHLDGSGRFSARALLRALGWAPGRRIDLAVVDEALVIGSSPTGRHTVGARGDIAVPGSARALLGLDTDHGVVLVAAPKCGVLVVHPHAQVAQLLAEHYRHQVRRDDT
ncbi:hypothetical protein [Actinoplanes sp. NPDC049118]|uniref:hypothetical protein n=1 Tax=Actinoplanes sp. NPDC049118 TaxID=3155769 RepID=UPI0033F2A44E